MSTINRLPGLATGMDTDTMVKSMLAAEQNKIDTLTREKIETEWKQSLYREVIADVKSFQDKFFGTGSNSLMFGSNWATSKTESTNSSVITATSGSGSVDVNFKFEVEKVATGDSLSAKVEPGTSLGLADSTELQIKTGVDSNGDDIITTIELNENDTVESLVSKLNVAGNGKFKATYSSFSEEFKIESLTTGEDSDLEIIGGDFGLTKKEGENSIIHVSDLDGNHLKTLSEKSNTFNVDGATYTVHGTGSATLTSTEDLSGITSKMEDFVKEYNALMDSVYSKILESPNNSYNPLTDEEKSSMSETEIKNWEEKAMEGLLRNDPDLRKFMDELSGNIFGDNTSFMQSIGISGHSDYNKRGQVSFDSSKFESAMKLNGTEIYNQLVRNEDSVFNGMNSTLQKYAGNSTSIFAKKAGITGTSSVGSNLYQTEIQKKEDKIKDLIDKMNQKETNLFKKFANLEVVMNRLNNQMEQFFSM